MEASTQDLKEQLPLASQSQTQAPAQSDSPAASQSDIKLNLDHLNDAQLASVQSDANFIEVLAGPGSGKTMVICHRIEYLVKIKHVDPSAIVTVTFTNRAAKEMTERTIKLIGHDKAKFLMMGTFHHVCAILLRKYGQQVGLSPDYTILDSSDSHKVIENAIKQIQKPPGNFFSTKELNKWTASNFISKCKNKRINPDEAIEDARGKRGGVNDSMGETLSHENLDRCAKIYKIYQSELKRLNCLDFDDLLGYVVDLFRTRPDTLRAIAARYKHVLVDEWQDTSTLQYEIAKGLCSVHQHLFVVGDPDQSIYSWRFAKGQENIKKFRKDFNKSGLVSVKLEENYRSSGNVLKLAHALITQDHRREEKRLICTMPNGHPVICAGSHTIYDEARNIAYTIKDLKQNIQDYSYGHTAILYRTNFQSRALEEALLREGIPHRIIGGVGYYERREIKDLISFLRLIGNPHDDFSLTRAINIPPRAIGEKWLADVRAEAQKRSCSMWTYIQSVRETKSAANAFIGFIEALQEQSEQGAPSMALLDAVLETTDYLNWLKTVELATYENRAENVEELRRACYTKDIELAQLKHNQMQGNQDDHMEDEVDWSSTKPLQHFLTHLALVAGDPREGKSKYEKIDSVNLMTMHAAKGLEWPVVFVCGCDALTVPHKKTSNRDEERRLLYVSATRAKALLFLTHPCERTSFGEGGGRPSLVDVGISPFLRSVQQSLPSKVTSSKNKDDFIVFAEKHPRLNFSQKNENNELISRLCRNFKLIEKPIPTTTDSPHSSQSSSQPTHQSPSTTPQLVRSRSDGGSFFGVLSPSMFQRESTQILNKEDAEDIDGDDDGDNLRPPARSESLKMLPLKFELDEEDARLLSAKRKRINESEPTPTSNSIASQPKRTKTEEIMKPGNPAPSPVPVPKKSPVKKINLVDDDDSYGFTSFKEKQVKKRVKAELNDPVTAKARVKGLKQMQEEAAKQAATILPPPIAAAAATAKRGRPPKKRVEIIAPPPAPKYPIATESSTGGGGRSRRQNAGLRASSPAYNPQAASGAALPVLKKKI